MPSPLSLSLAATAGLLLIASTASAETMTKTGKTAAGQSCTVQVERHADGSISAAGASGSSSMSSASAGSVSGSTTSGRSSVSVQAGNGKVSSSTTQSPGGASASVMTVNGCTISTSSP